MAPFSNIKCYIYCSCWSNMIRVDIFTNKMLYKYFKSANKCALIIFMLNLKRKEWKTQLQHTGLVLFIFNHRIIAHCCLYFYRELSQIISEVYHIKPLSWFKASAAALNLFRNTEPGYDCSERYRWEKLTGLFMRRVWEFLEHFTDALPLGLPIIPSLEVQDIGVVPSISLL